MIPYPPSQFRTLGDWLIYRSTSIFRDFQMPLCANIIAIEGLPNGWLLALTDDDIARILARYKEHVNYWNVSIETIRRELQIFATATNRNYYEIAARFDSLEPKRIPPA